VITDPPSFAPNEKSVPQATAALHEDFSKFSIRLAARTTVCSQQAPARATFQRKPFWEITREASQRPKKRGTVVFLGAQPVDHPYPRR